MSIIKSKNKVFDENSKKSVPVCKFDTDSLTVTIFKADTQTEEHYTFYSDYIRYHVHYVAAKYKERFQRHVDNGTIYKYLPTLKREPLKQRTDRSSVGRNMTRNISLLLNVVISRCC